MKDAGDHHHKQRLEIDDGFKQEEENMNCSWTTDMNGQHYLTSEMTMYECQIANSTNSKIWDNTVEPLYNVVLGTMKITLLYQVSRYIRVKNKEI